MPIGGWLLVVKELLRKQQGTRLIKGVAAQQRESKSGKRHLIGMEHVMPVVQFTRSVLSAIYEYINKRLYVEHPPIMNTDTLLTDLMRNA